MIGLLVRCSSRSSVSAERAVMSETVLFVRSSVCSPVRATSGAMSASAQPERFRLFSSGSVQIAASALLEMVQPERSSD